MDCIDLIDRIDNPYTLRPLHPQILRPGAQRHLAECLHGFGGGPWSDLAAGGDNAAAFGFLGILFNHAGDLVARTILDHGNRIGLAAKYLVRGKQMDKRSE